MKKSSIAFVAVAAFGIMAGSAQAGGWGHSSYSYRSSTGGNYGVSSGLVNVSPSVGLGDVNVLNGLSALNGSSVLSGILSGNRTSAGNGILGGGILNGSGVGILGGGNRTSISHSRGGRHHRW